MVRHGQSVAHHALEPARSRLRRYEHCDYSCRMRLWPREVAVRQRFRDVGNYRHRIGQGVRRQAAPRHFRVSMLRKHRPPGSILCTTGPRQLGYAVPALGSDLVERGTCHRLIWYPGRLCREVLFV